MARQPHSTAVGSHEVGGVVTRPSFLENAEEKIEGGSEAPAGGFLVGLRPESGHHRVAGRVGVDDEIADE